MNAECVVCLPNKTLLRLVNDGHRYGAIVVVRAAKSVLNGFVYQNISIRISITIGIKYNGLLNGYCLVAKSNDVKENAYKAFDTQIHRLWACVCVYI